MYYKYLFVQGFILMFLIHSTQNYVGSFIEALYRDWWVNRNALGFCLDVHIK